MHKIINSLILLIFLFFTGAIYAEDMPSTADAPDADINTDILTAVKQSTADNAKSSLNDTMVVTGAKTQTLLEHSVDKIGVVSSKDIDKMAAKNVAEVLENIPGITITRHPMEGVSMQGFKGAYVKILIDGVGVGGEVGGATPIAAIPTANIERIEIIKGAASVLYGSDAMGGVINIITKKNKKKWTAYTKQEFDMHKHYYGNLNLGYKADSFGLNATASFDDMPGMITREKNPLGRITDTFIFPHTRMGYARLAGDIFLPQGTLTLHSSYTDHMRYVNQTSDIANQYITKKAEGGIKGNFNIDNMLDINFFSDYKYFRHIFDEINTVYQNTPPFRRNATFNEVESELSTSYSIDMQNTILGGFNYKYANMKGIDFQQAKHSMLFSLFSQYNWNFDGADILQIEPGLRFDYAPKLGKNDAHLWNLTPKLALKYDPLPNLAWRLSYGMGYKVPTLKQKFWLFFHPAEPRFVLLGNPGLKPETSHSFNTSLDYEPIDKLKLGFSAYFNYVRNMIYANEIESQDGQYPDHDGNLIPVTGMRKYENIDKVLTTGADFSIAYDYKWLRSQLSYSLAQVYNYNPYKEVFFKGAYFVPHQIKLKLTGVIPVSFTEISLSFNWDAPQAIKAGMDPRGLGMIKAMDDTQYVKSPDKLIANLHISQDLWQDHINLYMGVKNFLHNSHFMLGTNGDNQKKFFGIMEGALFYAGFSMKY